MGLRLIIKTKNRVQQTGLMKIFDLIWDWGENEYLFHDENIPEMFLVFLSEHILPQKINSNKDLTKVLDIDIFKKYGDLTDDVIISHLENRWFRPEPYWINYKLIMESYLLAKRDYIKKLVEAEIIEIGLLQEDPNIRNAIITVTLQFESYVADTMKSKEHLESILNRIISKGVPNLKIIEIKSEKKQ